MRVCAHVYLYTRVHSYVCIRVRNFASSHPLYTQCLHTHTHTYHRVYISSSPFIGPVHRERGNSHLRATIKTIDDWRGHLDLKIYLRGSASHTHTHTHIHTCVCAHTYARVRSLKQDWIIDQLSPSRASRSDPFRLSVGVSWAPYTYAYLYICAIL
jgi:hypothetical protein